jgi:hypothetical protein
MINGLPPQIPSIEKATALDRAEPMGIPVTNGIPNVTDYADPID